MCDTEKKNKEMTRKSITQSRSPGAKGDDTDEGQKNENRQDRKRIDDKGGQKSRYSGGAFDSRTRSVWEFDATPQG